ncbi:DUF7674 family protein [Pseudoduganella violaceinigra]|uniref:DUF7674 family protein n=1 Tax=Pseudoduganella violaceinigra TaxID=246602 RepID=UPI0004837A85|nr:hypothetical protein [Pseudoduganella violaceinigra]
MKTVLDLYNAVRSKFPAIRKKADTIHVRQWGEIDSEFAYSWFESLANALNAEMNRQVEFKVYEPLFVYFGHVLQNASEEVYRCIDVAFVENLFWQVSSAKCAAYWPQLPPAIRELYLGFHHREP